MLATFIWKTLGLLLEQRAGLALAPGGLVADARALFLLDLRVQHAAQAHLHRMHRGVRRTRKT